MSLHFTSATVANDQAKPLNDELRRGFTLIELLVVITIIAEYGTTACGGLPNNVTVLAFGDRVAANP